MERTISRSSTFKQILLDFAAKVKELTNQAVDGRPYVLVEKLWEWMRKIGHTKLEDKFVTNTDLLAHAVYYDRNSDFLPIVPSRISDPGSRLLLDGVYYPP